MAQKLETRCEKKQTLICLKFSPKNLYLTKKSLYRKTFIFKRGGGLITPKLSKGEQPFFYERRCPHCIYIATKFHHDL